MKTKSKKKNDKKFIWISIILVTLILVSAVLNLFYQLKGDADFLAIAIMGMIFLILINAAVLILVLKRIKWILYAVILVHMFYILAGVIAVSAIYFITLNFICNVIIIILSIVLINIIKGKKENKLRIPFYHK